MIFLNSCRTLNPSVMMKTKKDFKYSTFPQTISPQYKLAPNDQISFRIYSNDGFRLIDVTAAAGSGLSTVGATQSGLTYKIEFDGTIKMPLIGRTKLEGMTVRDAEVFLEDKYSAFYNKPYVLLEVSNRRVIIFPGSAGTARVIKLANENTTLIEALAEAGGITQTGKAYKVKLIRGDLKNPEVYLIDLSTLDGVKQANLVMQANDIIYIEPKLSIAQGVIGQILPYVSFITSMIVFYEFIKTSK